MENVRPDNLGGLGYPALHEMIEAAKADLAASKAWLDRLNGELEARLGNSARQQLSDAGKTFGTVNMPLQDGMTAKVEIPKKIEWDSDKLFNLALTMPVNRARTIFKFAVSVPEKIFDGIKAADPALGDAISEARTTKVSTPKITLVKEG